MSAALSSFRAADGPEETRRGVIVNMQTCADTLKVSRQTLHIWLRKWPEFPVESRGTNGQQYQFDVARVLDFLADKKAEEARKTSERDEALAQFVLPLLGEPEPQTGRGASIKDQIEAIRLSRLRREEAERLGQLVSADALRQGLSIALANWQRDLHLALRRVAEETNLPDQVTRLIDARLADAQRAFVRELRDHLAHVDV